MMDAQQQQMVRGNDEVVFWLRDIGNDCAWNLSAIHIAVTCARPVCHQSFVYYKELFDHFRLIHYNGAKHDRFLNTAYGILQEVTTFYAQTS